MLTIKFDIKDEVIDEAIADIEEFYGVMPTRRYFTSLLKKHPQLVVDLWQGDFDTESRENFIEQMALNLINRPWPLMGNSNAVKKRFEKEFVKAAKKAKIKLEDDWSCSNEEW